MNAIRDKASHLKNVGKEVTGYRDTDRKPSDKTK